MTLSDPETLSVLMASNHINALGSAGDENDSLAMPPQQITLSRASGVLTLSASQHSKRIKKNKRVTDCPHVDEPYYSKGMCRNCYNARGRKKPSTACEHSNRPNYALGLCKNCYLKKYHRARKAPAAE